MKYERWKDIVGYEGFYQISNKGRVRSLDRYVPIVRSRSIFYIQFVKGRTLKLQTDHYGYLVANLRRNGRKKENKIHRLIAIAFIPNPHNKPVINHKDGTKTNNSIRNLEWCTQADNLRHAIRTGLITKNYGNRNYTKLSKSDVLKIDRLLKTTGLTYMQIATKYGVSKSAISSISLGMTWSKVTRRIKGEVNLRCKPTKVISCRGDIFTTLGEAAKFAGIKSNSGICLCCKGLKNYAGKYKDGTPIKWKYLTQD